MPPSWTDRFARLVEEKTGQAAGARLFRYETELEEPAADAVAVGNPWSRELFDGPFYLQPAREPARPACSLVFVQSADGNTVIKDPSVLGGGDTDKHLIYEGLSRVAADAVMAGAETVRDGTVVFSVWHPELVSLRASLGLPRHPIQIIATLRGLSIDRMLLCNVPEIRVVVLTTAAGARQMTADIAERPWITPIVMTSGDDLPRAFTELGKRGVTRISCVGGRTLAAQMLRRGLVDDVYLTTAPRAGGTLGTPISEDPWRGRALLRKHGTGDEAGVVFEHVLAR